MPDDQYFTACSNPACLRKVAAGSHFCCGGCSQASAGKYDPVGYHSKPCDERAAERGEFTAHEAAMRRGTRAA